MSRKININCDMGESFGRYTLGSDAALVRYVPTINVACGFHAGDPHVMRRTVQLAKEYNVEIGAHIALPDLLGFGRRRIEISPDELADYVLYQMGALSAFAQAVGMKIGHIKPHGVLYTMCGEDESLARALLGAVMSIDPNMVIIVGGRLPLDLGLNLGLTVVNEGYVDLGYKDSGFPLIERVKQFRDPYDVADRAIRLVQERKAQAESGCLLDITVPTLCIHGDGPNAEEIARVLRERLAEEDIAVVSLREAIAEMTRE